MWKYKHELDYETRLKLTPFCEEWQSVCWILLKIRAILNVIIFERSAAFLTAVVVVLFSILCGLTYMYRRYKQKDEELMMLRERVQFFNEDINNVHETLYNHHLNEDREVLQIDEKFARLLDTLDAEAEPKLPAEKLEPGISESRLNRFLPTEVRVAAKPLENHVETLPIRNEIKPETNDLPQQQQLSKYYERNSEDNIESLISPMYESPKVSELKVDHDIRSFSVQTECKLASVLTSTVPQPTSDCRVRNPSRNTLRGRTVSPTCRTSVASNLNNSRNAAEPRNKSVEPGRHGGAAPPRSKLPRWKM